MISNPYDLIKLGVSPSRPRTLGDGAKEITDGVMSPPLSKDDISSRRGCWVQGHLPTHLRRNGFPGMALTREQ